MLNPCILHWNSYNKEGRKEGKKEVFVSVVCYELSIVMQELNDTLIIDSMKRMLVCMVE